MGTIEDYEKERGYGPADTGSAGAKDAADQLRRSKAQAAAAEERRLDKEAFDLKNAKTPAQRRTGKTPTKQAR